MEVSFIDLQFCIKVILQHKINQRWNPLKYKCPYIRQPWYLKELAIFLNDRIDFLLKTKIHIMKLVRFEIFISLKQRPSSDVIKRLTKLKIFSFHGDISLIFNL